MSAENEDINKLLLWKRFIDDVLSLFRGSYEEAKLFVDWLNSLLPGVIKFTFEYSEVQINFLDITLKFAKSEGKTIIETNLYVKPSNKQLFLDIKSPDPLQKINCL